MRNVIKLSKFAFTKKCPPQIFEVGIFSLVNLGIIQHSSKFTQS